LEEVPDETAGEERLDVPDPSAQEDGAFTRLTNVGTIADALSRDPEHLHRAVQRELGTNGQYDAGRARYNGFDAAIDKYVQEFVICSECGLPDTRLVMEDRTLMLRCDACGAFRPVTKRTGSTEQAQQPTLEEGGSYQVEITGTGRKGDGVAERGEYTIFVPGASEGDVVDIYIDNISGTLAFARLAG
jgi:translation initiation factor 2 subunit 2